MLDVLHPCTTSSIVRDRSPDSLWGVSRDCRFVGLPESTRQAYVSAPVHTCLSWSAGLQGQARVSPAVPTGDCACMCMSTGQDTYPHIGSLHQHVLHIRIPGDGEVDDRTPKATCCVHLTWSEVDCARSEEHMIFGILLSTLAWQAYLNSSS